MLIQHFFLRKPKAIRYVTGTIVDYKPEQLLVVDVGNSNTHFALTQTTRLQRGQLRSIPTSQLAQLSNILSRRHSPIQRLVACCVVPNQAQHLHHWARHLTGRPPLLVHPRANLGITIRYPNPAQIGADRLANSIAAAYLYGVFAPKPYRGPVVIVDFGSAVNFDVVSADGAFLGGIIGPGVAAMTEYLHEKTALLPRITIREPRGAIGKSTVEAMRIGAVIGYRGMIRELLRAIKTELRVSKIRVIATGGYAHLMATKLPEIERVDPLLTLQGLRIFYLRNTHPKK